jgi:circadian clock protein KaiC
MTQESDAFDGGIGEALGVVLADNLIRLRSVEYHNRLRRVLSILKMRQSAFDPTLREFRIDEGVIRVLPIEESGADILGGIATQEGRAARAGRRDGDA